MPGMRLTRYKLKNKKHHLPPLVTAGSIIKGRHLLSSARKKAVESMEKQFNELSQRNPASLSHTERKRLENLLVSLEKEYERRKQDGTSNKDGRQSKRGLPPAGRFGQHKPE